MQIPVLHNKQGWEQDPKNTVSNLVSNYSTRVEFLRGQFSQVREQKRVTEDFLKYLMKDIFEIQLRRTKMKGYRTTKQNSNVIIMFSEHKLSYRLNV